jgi:hypothetical protein
LFSYHTSMERKGKGRRGGGGGGLFVSVRTGSRFLSPQKICQAIRQISEVSDHLLKTTYLLKKHPVDVTFLGN